MLNRCLFSMIPQAVFKKYKFFPNKCIFKMKIISSILGLEVYNDTLIPLEHNFCCLTLCRLFLLMINQSTGTSLLLQSSLTTKVKKFNTGRTTNNPIHSDSNIYTEHYDVIKILLLRSQDTKSVCVMSRPKVKYKKNSIT